MVNKFFFSVILIASLTFFSSCETDDLNDLGWKPEILAPIAKTSLDFYDFEDLLFATNKYEIFADQLPIPGFAYDQEIDVPPIDSTDFPPEYLSISDFFKSISVDSAKVNIKIKNIFPIPIGEGTRIIANDSASGNLLFDHPTNREIGPGEEYTFDFVLRDGTLSSALAFSVQDFTSPGKDNVTFTQNALEVEIDIEFVVIQEVVVKKNVEYEIARDTVDFDFGVEEAKDTAAYSGYLSLLIDSYFPTTMIMSLELLDENDQKVYDFFEQEPNGLLELPSGKVNANGYVYAKTEVNLLNYIDLRSDIALIDRGKKMVVSGIVKTDPNPDQFVFTERTQIIISITGRIKIDPSQVQ